VPGLQAPRPAHPGGIYGTSQAETGPAETGPAETEPSGTGPAGDVIRAELPADLTSARHGRAAVRQALAAWGMDDPSGDAELLASELAANAAEHGTGPVSLALRRQAAHGGQAAISCEITDSSPAPPRQRQAGTDAERGRGLPIVTALASTSGPRATEAGKTTWFTLALTGRAGRLTPHTEPQAEAEAGA
jgi:anti-sigma regulatory factor (Ser/Thr protein kinase)